MRIVLLGIGVGLAIAGIADAVTGDTVEGVVIALGGSALMLASDLGRS